MRCLSAKIISRSPGETERIGFNLGTFLKSSGSAKTVMLYGDLGTGKTTLVKGIASAFGIAKRDICSASFVIVAEYETSPPFYHMDLYRLERPEAVDAAGVWEYIGTGGVVVIEWAERLHGDIEDAVKVYITHLKAEEREIIIEGVNSAEFMAACEE
ncbi:MAG: tRNA (adenosine(37)-N6)-threonylcarbamoyltransferase complex ATPase subunit type 1 TsaE [Nitrospirae bacterium]|nr:tRNA (adenosine(37)-N6)-threonylcarbamoyltransferase complex ATPase subunit type 1 TsaE [Nitrospirota bacterium]